MQLKHLLHACFLLVFCFFSTAASAQNKTISGKVTDGKDGSPIIGASVKAKNSSAGASTGADGSFQINVPESATTLVVSYVGYANQEVAIAGKSVVNISLVESTTSLNEVVVSVGYGTQRVKDATGSVASLGSRNFNKGVISSPEQLLQGRVSGVQVTPASGEPGAGVNIRIRGTTSVRSGNNPLFVIDGVPMDGSSVSDGGGDNGVGTLSARNPLTFMNPDDIENISVLKDASSAAIYGSRGANGVVLITTKKGRSGQQSASFNSSISMANALKTYDLLSPEEFIAKSVEIGKDPAKVNFGAKTNWQDEIFRTGVTQNYSLGFGGGNDNTLYRFSASSSNQGGIVKTSGLNRSTGRMNASHELFEDKVKIELQLTAAQLKDRYAPIGDNAGFQGNLIGAAIAANPTQPITAKSGLYNQSFDFRNPVAMLDYINDRGVTTKLLGNMALNWKIVDGLAYKLNLGIDNSSSNRTSTFSSLLSFDGIENKGRAVLASRNLNSRLIEHTLNYAKVINKNSFDVLGGFSYQKFENNGFNTRAEGFLNNLIPYEENLGNVDSKGALKPFTANSYKGGYDMQSYFGRTNYAYNDKYLLTATLRVDGSSKFGSNNKYGYFPSVAAAWRISEESFVSKDIFQNLKLRASYGLNGNQEFPAGSTNATYDYTPTGAIRQINNENPDLRWEITKQYSVGLDFETLKGRLSGSLEYYNKSTNDLLYYQPLAQPNSAQFIWKNLPADVQNTGLEVNLNYSIIKNTNFTWDLSANAASLKNIVKNFKGSTITTGSINGQGLSGAVAQIIQEGLPLFGFYLREFTGFKADGSEQFSNNEELAFRGSALPKYNFGLNNAFTYKNVSLSFFLNGATGFYVFNNTGIALLAKGSLNSGRNITVDAANSGQSAGSSVTPSTRYLEKGDFVRLSNLNLAYTFKMLNTKYVKGVTVNFTGQNLFLITKYSGLDPEVNTNKAVDGIPSLGIDYTSYPSARTFSLGAAVNF
jgi:iron complex outermembrane receptor protein